MAKVTVAGDAVVVTSALKMEDLKTIKKYRPKALTLMGGEDGKEPIFSVDIGPEGSINSVGAVFNGESHNEGKFAMLTVSARGVAGEIKDWVADTLGGALINLNKLEAALPAALKEISEEKAAVVASIEVLA